MKKTTLLIIAFAINLSYSWAQVSVNKITSKNCSSINNVGGPDTVTLRISSTSNLLNLRAVVEVSSSMIWGGFLPGPAQVNNNNSATIYKLPKNQDFTLSFLVTPKNYEYPNDSLNSISVNFIGNKNKPLANNITFDHKFNCTKKHFLDKPYKKITTELDSFSYAFGLMMAQQLRGAGIKHLDYSAFLHGFEDGMSRDSGYVIPSNMLESTLQNYSTKARAIRVEELQKENTKFLQSKTKEGYITLPAGSYIKLLKKGSGKVSGPYDTIEYRFVYLDKNGNEAEAMKNLNPGRDPMQMLREGFTDFYDAMQLAPEGSEFVVLTLNEQNESIKKNAINIEEAYGISKIVFQVIKITPGKKPTNIPKQLFDEGQPEMPAKKAEMTKKESVKK